MANVTIGCRLPNGLVLEVGDKSVELAGQRQTQQRSKIILLSPDDYGTTEVDESFWQAWKQSVGKDFAPLASGAIFEAKNTNDASAKAKDLKSKKTGHEAMELNTDGVQEAQR
jgi:hypothetical protein